MAPCIELELLKLRKIYCLSHFQVLLDKNFVKAIFSINNSDGSGLPEPENPTRTRGILPNPKLPEPEFFKTPKPQNPKTP